MAGIQLRRLALSGLILAVLWSLAACSVPEGAPGSGAARSDPTASAPTAVTVGVDRERYVIGEPIAVTIENGLDVSIFAPPTGHCSIVSLSRLEAGRWKNVDSCPSSNVSVTEIPGNGQLTGALGPANQPPNASGPIVIDPVAPAASGDDVTTLATIAPWRSGDPVHVVPEGAIAPPFSSAGVDREPGTYRLEFRFSQGSASGPVSITYSGLFIVAE